MSIDPKFVELTADVLIIIIIIIIIIILPTLTRWRGHNKTLLFK